MRTSIRRVNTHSSNHLDRGLIIRDEKKKNSLLTLIEEEKTFLKTLPPKQEKASDLIYEDQTQADFGDITNFGDSTGGREARSL